MSVVDETPIVEVRASDYAGGSYVYQSNGRYRLMDDVVFHPNPDNDFMPTAQQLADGTYNAMASQIGFTTANIIAGHDIDIDLNGHTIEQSPEHALQQRFFSLFQFGKTPFIDKAGPLDFVEGDVFVGPQRITIRNGTIGRSSHHGIQGNDCRNVVLEDLRIVDFEVAAVSVNLVNDMTLRRCTLGPTRRNVPVVAAYSQARFLRIFARKILTNADTPVVVAAEGQAALAALEARLAAVREDVLGIGHTDDVLFGNPSGLPDGSAAYGVVVHGRGPAVNDFSPMPDDDDTETQFSERLRLHSVDVTGIVAAPRQTVGVSLPANAGAGTAESPSGSYAPGVQHDCVGAILDMKLLRNPVTDEYRPNELADLQAFLTAHRALLPARDRARVTISDGMAAWMRTPGAKLTDVMNAEQLYFLYNGDAMFHVMKGVMGVRLDRVQQAVLQDVSVRHSHNQGPLESTLDGSLYDTSHPNQTQTGGYQGAVCRGIVASACRKVRCRGVTVDGVRSDFGQRAAGIELMNESDVSFADEPRVTGIEAPHGDEFSMLGFAAESSEPPHGGGGSSDSHSCVGGGHDDHDDHDDHHDHHDDHHDHDHHDDHHDHDHHDDSDHGHEDAACHSDSDFDPPHGGDDTTRRHDHDDDDDDHHHHPHNSESSTTTTTWVIIVATVLFLLLVWWWLRRRRRRTKERMAAPQPMQRRAHHPYASSSY
jgi:hypothetical protein